MIAHLEGTLAVVAETYVVLDVRGVGYRVTVSGATSAQLPEPGEALRLPTYLVVRDDSLTLFGFVQDTERDLFEQLLAVSGVGPKLAQQLVTTLSPSELVQAIVTGDEARLSQVPGIGKRLAQRLTVELADRVGRLMSGELAADAAPAGASAADVVDALKGLGFSAGEAQRAARRALQTAGEGAPVEVLIREALRGMNHPA